mmetsp:Transcript_17279/g.37590  ORF Transcript_17279/g.37590 Transcript_17279/m.37590 type:complete len:283 (-) Transcript_17279:297-1145(-)
MLADVEEAAGEAGVPHRRRHRRLCLVVARRLRVCERGEVDDGDVRSRGAGGGGSGQRGSGSAGALHRRRNVLVARHRSVPDVPTCQHLAHRRHHRGAEQLSQHIQVALGEGRVPHVGVHGGRHQQGLLEVPRAHHAGEEVVAESVGRLGEGVGGEWSNDQRVRPPPQLDVQHRVAHLCPIAPLIVVPENLPQRSLHLGLERPDEVPCWFSGNHFHLRKLSYRSSKQPDLDGGYTSAHPKEDLGSCGCWQRRRCGFCHSTTLSRIRICVLSCCARSAGRFFSP